MPRSNKILIRTGSAAPSASDFATSEPAWDSSAGKLYVKNAAGAMVEVGAGGGSGTTEVLEYSSPSAFPATGTAARIYVSTSTGRLYRWQSSVYVEIGGKGVSGPDGGTYA